MIDPPIIHVAYADDHKVVRKGVISFINNSDGIQVDIEADNGKELIKNIEKAKHIPDVCLLDINMPVMNGFDTIVELKKRWPVIKILILTVFDIEMYIIRMIMHGANGYLLKSCDPEEIKKAILSVQETGIYYSDKVTRQFYKAIQDKEITLPKLTEKEIGLLSYACSDLSYAEIAQKLNTTARSVEGHRDNLFRKLKTSSRVSLALFAIQLGLVVMDINTSEDKKFLNKKQKK